MTLNEYQELATATAIFPEENAIAYLTLGLNGEAGEVAEKIKKHFRDGRPIDRAELIKELGDVLWYTAVLANQLHISLSLLAESNLNKLASRKARGTLQGSGDNR
jgi:NTP pyrophosphatase (non-canonical NTP hydrolase)